MQLFPETDIAEIPDGGNADPLKQLQDEGKLPVYGTGTETKPPVLGEGGPEVMSLYLPSVDPDQDNVPNIPIPEHPEINLDNCPSLFNPGQGDANNNAIGDACENL